MIIRSSIHAFLLLDYLDVFQIEHQKDDFDRDYQHDYQTGFHATQKLTFYTLW